MSKLDEAQAFASMKDSVGWRLLEKHIRERAADHRGQLMHVKTWEEVLQHRSQADAFESVLSHIEQTIREGVEEDVD